MIEGEQEHTLNHIKTSIHLQWQIALTRVTTMPIEHL